ncbi:MAG: YibE/F family protein [Firmicutes bacterium]|nr:YibE/F family protein [Bacillota bacterium]
MKKDTIIIVLLAIILSIASITSSNLFKEKNNGNYEFEKAKVLQINQDKTEEDNVLPNSYLGYQDIKVKILSGEHEGEVFNIRNSLSRLYNVRTKENMTIIVRLFVKDDILQNVIVFNYSREIIIFSLIALFFIVLILFGRKEGVKSIISLVFTSIVVVFFMLPMIFRGYDPVPIAIITVSVATMITLPLIAGCTRKSLAAILGTIVGIIIAGVISYIAGNLAHLSGVTMEEAEELIYLAGDVGLKVKGLMFAGILIASLGAVMDVAMSIASSIFEVHNNNPKLSSKELFTSGMNVGRDVMGTMSNTLILAFAGGSLNVMILIVAYQMPYNQLINLDLVGTELIQGLAGSIGIVLTVPFTALISSVLSKNKSS